MDNQMGDSESSEGTTMDFDEWCLIPQSVYSTGRKKRKGRSSRVRTHGETKVSSSSIISGNVRDRRPKGLGNDLTAVLGRDKHCKLMHASLLQATEVQDAGRRIPE
jgi:hypothetical protein